MKAVVYNRKSSPDKLTYRDVEKPTPKDDEVLVRIHAVSINAADYRSMKMGLIPKRKIFGADISGVLESVGKNIIQFVRRTRNGKSGDKCGMNYKYRYTWVS